MTLDFTKTDMPDVPMAMVTNLPLSREHWTALALRVSYQTLRMNLKTFERHGVFKDGRVCEAVAKRLCDPDQVRRSRAQPYQLMQAYVHGEALPRSIRAALKSAMELATANVPVVEGEAFVLIDVSGSMHGALTGVRKGATTAVRCIDAAAMIAACILRKNSWAKAIAFSDDVIECSVPRQKGVFTMAEILTSLPAGGTNCSSPLRRMNKEKSHADLVIMVSDNQSWMDPTRSGATAMHDEWNRLKQRCPGALLVCIDVQPEPNVQVPERRDVLNIGGFSDAVFGQIETFTKSGGRCGHWVEQIELIAV